MPRKTNVFSDRSLQGGTSAPRPTFGAAVQDRSWLVFLRSPKPLLLKSISMANVHGPSRQLGENSTGKPRRNSPGVYELGWNSMLTSTAAGLPSCRSSTVRDASSHCTSSHAVPSTVIMVGAEGSRMRVLTRIPAGVEI